MSYGQYDPEGTDNTKKNRVLSILFWVGFVVFILFVIQFAQGGG